VNVQTSWIPPRVEWTKINVDGGFVDQTGEAGIGIIARNIRGTRPSFQRGESSSDVTVLHLRLKY
jgi:hypothetical protein